MQGGIPSGKMPTLLEENPEAGRMFVGDGEET
jgi:hypothetical protein